MLAIQTNSLGKRYRLGTDAGGYDTLRAAVARRLRGSQGEHESRSVWALRDVDLVVEEGEAVGVIGRNGGGKTTLLRILARITEPTTGEARTRGQVGAMLEVGTGFHPELTGRENVYLNGAILGMSRSDVRSRFDEIVEFSGVERFLDTPVKRYSTGMQLRLAFAIAAHIEPQILVVDEVLAVGDAEFRERCLGKMAEIGRHGRTVLFVSHDLGAVRSLCSRTIWLERGRLRADGIPSEVIPEYLGTGVADRLLAEFEPNEEEVVSLTRVSIVDRDERVLATMLRGEQFGVDVRFSLRERTPGLDLALSIVDSSGVRLIYDARSDWAEGGGLPGAPGRYRARAVVPGLLLPGRYALEIWIGTEHETLFERQVLNLELMPRPGDRQEWIDRPRAVQPKVVWKIGREPFPPAEGS